MKISTSSSLSPVEFNYDIQKISDYWSYNGKYMGSGTAGGTTILSKNLEEYGTSETHLAVCNWLDITITHEGKVHKQRFYKKEFTLDEMKPSFFNIDDYLVSVFTRNLYKFPYSPSEICSIKVSKVVSHESVILDNRVKLVPRHPCYEK